MALPTFRRLIRFTPPSDSSRILIGTPLDEALDIGVALAAEKPVRARVWSGGSVLAPGKETEREESVGKILSPLDGKEVGTIRCIGLNYRQHAREVHMAIPTVPTIFMKPATSLSPPWPTMTTMLPHITQQDDSGDYESELVVVLGKTAKNIKEEDAMDYVLGYTAGNDVSSRTVQLNQSQWSYSKGFDGAAPIGPTLVSKDLIPDPSKLKMRGIRNGEVVQECGIDDLIFSIPKLVSFLSQGTTLHAGTIIMTGTPAGVGFSRKPKLSLKDGDEFRVEILPHIGTLVNKFENEN